MRSELAGRLAARAHVIGLQAEALPFKRGSQRWFVLFRVGSDQIRAMSVSEAEAVVRTASALTSRH